MAVPAKFHGSGGHSKRKCLPDRANFYRSWEWHIVLILNTAHTHTYLYNKDTYILCNHQFSIPFPLLYHDDVIKWKHFPRYWPFVQGIHRSPVNSPHKGQWRGALMFTLICARIKGWVNNREAGDLSRHRAHCDIIVLYILPLTELPSWCGWHNAIRQFPNPSWSPGCQGGDGSQKVFYTRFLIDWALFAN